MKFKEMNGCQMFEEMRRIKRIIKAETDAIVRMTLDSTDYTEAIKMYEDDKIHNYRVLQAMNVVYWGISDDEEIPDFLLAQV